MRGLVATLALVLAIGGAARADPIADFYHGRSISWILSAGAGGGYASYAEAFAPYFGAHIPGKPNIVIQNMPGGGGLRAMLYLNSVAPKDGTTLGLVHSSVPFAPLYGIGAARFDPRKMNWIGSIDASTGICVSWHTSGIATWQDMLTKPFTVGSTGAGSQMETMPMMLDNLFGTKIKVVAGYVGGNDIYLAMERGEIAGRCGGLISSIKSTRPDWFPQHKVNVPIQISRAAQSAVSRCPGGRRIRQGCAHEEYPEARAVAAEDGSPDSGAARCSGGPCRRAARGISCRDGGSRLHRAG